MVQHIGSDTEQQNLAKRFLRSRSSAPTAWGLLCSRRHAFGSWLVATVG